MSLAQPIGAGKLFGLDIMQNMKVFRIERLIAVFEAVLLLTGCAEPPPTALEPASPLNLAVYATQTLPVKPTPGIPATEIPISTPTPSTYTVKQGDTLLGIALRSGVSLSELLAANPGIRAEALRIGQVIQIPAARPPEGMTPPAAAELGETACYPVWQGFPSQRGVYCFVPVHHSGEGWLENVKVQVTLFDAEGRLVTSQEALPLLTGLPAGKTIPAAAFFPGIETYGALQTQVLTAIQTDGTRYLPVEIRNLLVEIAWGGLSAQVQGQVWLPPDAKPARTIWLAGVAHDVDGNVVGVRRWEWSGSLAPGETLLFSFAVYSAGPAIARVEVLAEARP